MGQNKKTMKQGQTVKLKSGGPVMTLDRQQFGSLYSCKWFSGNDLCEKSFHLDTLEVVETEN